MKVTVSKKDEKKDLSFPKLMESEGGLVVLMHKNGYGTIMSNNSIYEVGSYHSDWDTPCFHDFNGTITLQND